MQNLDKRKISAKKSPTQNVVQMPSSRQRSQSWASSQYTILGNFGYIVHVTQSKGMTHSYDGLGCSKWLLTWKNHESDVQKPVKNYPREPK